MYGNQVRSRWERVAAEKHQGPRTPHQLNRCTDPATKVVIADGARGAGKKRALLELLDSHPKTRLGSTLNGNEMDRGAIS